MSLKLYSHPLASFCWKVLIALYEKQAPFEAVMVNLGDEHERAAFEKISPLAKIPALVDEARGRIVTETVAMFEYLDAFHPGKAKLIPDGDGAWRAHMGASFYDSYLHLPMQRIVAENFRPGDQKDPFGVAEAHDTIRKAYAVVEQQLAQSTWAAGETFTIADCAAAPALIYADCVEPIPPEHRAIAVYMDRLRARPSVHRTLTEAEPWFQYFPIARKPRI